MWVEFESTDDRARASRAIEDDEPYPYCVTPTEIFLVDLKTIEDVGGFCREVGASQPVGEPVS